jgi:hypothetical protein
MKDETLSFEKGMEGLIRRSWVKRGGECIVA